MSDEPLSLELAAIIAQLHLGDLAEIGAQCKGKGRVGEVSDQERAYSLYAEDLATVQQMEIDRRFALSLETAGHADGPVLDELSAREEEERRDHEIAVAVSNGRTVQQPTRLKASTSRSTSRASASRYSQTASLAPIVAVSLAPSKDDPPIASASGERVPCIICTEVVTPHKSVRVPCASKHVYCAECLCDLFRAATRDESLFPPRCDGAKIPVALVKPHLTSVELAAFERKAVEFSTSNRLYCAEAACSAFLGAASESRQSIRCPTCSTQTCAACKAPWHGVFGLCGGSTDDQAAEILERDMQFRRCPGCKRVVELDTGCYHMTCFCQTQFCYLCAAPWKTCECPQWDEDRLYRAVQERVHAHAPDEEEEPDYYQDLLEYMRQNHHCLHTRWKHRDGGGRCQRCSARMGRFLLRCNGCQMLACVRCRRNRL